MSENLRTFLAIARTTTGTALLAYAGCRQYVTLPEERAPRHVMTRTALLVVGLAPALLGAGILRLSGLHRPPRGRTEHPGVAPGAGDRPTSRTCWTVFVGRGPEPGRVA